MDSVSSSLKPEYGQAIVVRRAELNRKSAMKIEEETNGLIYQKLLYRIEDGDVDPTKLEPEKIAALLSALEWTKEDFEEKTKLKIADMPTRYRKSEVVRSTGHVPTFRLTISQNGRREFVPTDIRTYIDEDWPGEFEAAILSEDNGVRRTIIYQLTGQAQNGQTIILEVKESGKTVATVIDIQEDTQTYFLEAETPFVVKNPEILGVVWRETKDYIRG